MSDIKELIASKLRPVANAIRVKKEVSEPINVDDFEKEILSIPDAELLKTTLKKIVNQDYKWDDIIPDLTLPGFLQKINTPYLLEGLRFQNLTFEEGIEEIGKNVLKSANVFVTVTIPKSLKTLDSTAFQSCKFNQANRYYNGSLDDFIKFPKTASFCVAFFPNIYTDYLAKNTRNYFKNENNEYYDFTQIKEVVIPEDVETLPAYSVYGLPGKLSIPNKNILFSSNACTGFNNNVPNLEKNKEWFEKHTYDFEFDVNTTPTQGGFFAGSYFKNITIKSSLGTGSGIFENGRAWDISFGSEVKNVPSGCFTYSKCNSINLGNVETISRKAIYYTEIFSNELVIPETVNSIEAEALATDLKVTFIFKATTPCAIASNTFVTSRIGKIYVPKNYSSVYKTATNWSTYADYIFEPNTVTVSIPNTLLNNESYTYSIDGGDFQQFTASSLTLENIATFKIKNSGDVTINIGTTDGGTEIGSVGAGAELLYGTVSDTTIYLTVA